jgi:hypothetical protein
LPKGRKLQKPEKLGFSREEPASFFLAFGSDNIKATMHGLVFLLLGGVLYFLPTLIGHKKANAGAIFVLNLLLGWTVIGWIVALVWALTVDAAQPATTIVVPPAASSSIKVYCSSCGRAIDSGGRFCPGCGTPVPR